ncbi:uncharacterized protein At4g06598-like [Rutidosis leptorrhynchoides]|uniref:uncharacterized protein At4g06598-like n=1 Tax=Rutidosis leptorrhynchoides TaxID=125765 RepID=UPI003A99C893
MENSKGQSSSTMRNMYSGKHYSLPPKSPFPSIAPFYADYASSRSNGTIPKYKNGNSLHQRTSSESLAIEEQPSWLNDLLDEPDTPVKKGHRRSSSDSFTYIEAANANIEHAAQTEYRLKNLNSASSTWGPQEFDRFKDSQNTFKNHDRVWDPPQNGLSRSTSLGASQEVNRVISTVSQKQESVESSKKESERSDFSNTQASASESDTKRSKQQFAQRSRVRKLQYIAELERNVQALQTEGSEVSGELKFLNQRSLILTMENKALKQRLENLAQEQLIKYLEHEVLEREISRLRALYKKQLQPPTEKPLVGLRRNNSMESQFANLSLNNESRAARDVVSGPLRI